jgi:hypothetical protein
MNGSPSPSVIVLGAGLQGVCAALALCREGYAVTIVDQASEWMTRASRHNEGKIHLGFVYAKDSSDRTPHLMLHAALRFAPIMEKLLDRTIPWESLKAKPFTYLVLNDSMLSPTEIEAAYARLQERYTEEMREPGLHYLGSRPERIFNLAPGSKHRRLLNPERTVAIIDTIEAPLATERFRSCVAATLDDTGGIERLLGHRIHFVERTTSGFRVGGAGPEGTSWTREADIVVNCLWEGRLKLDEQMGLLPRRPWVYRLKLRLFGELPKHLASLPSLTMVLGRYGDIVVDPLGPAYLSWYPASLRGWSDAVSPPAAWEGTSTGKIPARESADLSRRIIEGFESIVPGISDTRPLDLAGGVIFSWGESDIDDPESELHQRHEIGVGAHDGYYTINTGKFTCAPLFAEDLVRQIQGARSCI